MAISPGYVNSFRLELLQGIHDFSEDTIKMALLSENADMNPSNVTSYGPTGEIAGTGYTPGGYALFLQDGYPKLSTTPIEGIAAGGIAMVHFDDASTPAISVSGLRGALLYNSSKSNKAIALIDFGQTFTLAGQTFTVQWPNPDLLAAPIIKLN